MSLATYSDLQTAVANWLHRDDLTSNIPDFIALAEARMNGHIESRSMESRTNLTCTAGNAFVSLPTDMLEMKRLTVSSVDPVQVLKYATPDEISKDYPYSTTGEPVVFTVIGPQIQLAPIPDTAYTLEITYLQKIPALSNSNTTNWVLTNYPDVYLYGALVQSVGYTQDFGNLQTFQTLYRDAVDNLNAIDWYSGSSMAVRVK